MKYKLQPFKVPADCRIIKNDFTTYDPEKEFDEDFSLNSLTEDLLQLEFKNKDIVVDLGWYGDSGKNQGTFKIYVIKGSDWENQIKVHESKHQKIITQQLELILKEMSLK